MSLIALLAGSPPAAGITYLVNDNLEYADATAAGVGGWTTISTPTWNFTPALEGIASLRCSSSAQSVSHAFTAQSDVWVYMMLNYASDASNSLEMSLIDGSSVVVATGQISSTGIVKANSGGGTNTNSAAGEVVAGTTYHFWFHYTKGTGANAIMAIYRSTDGIKPGTPSANRTGGSSTTDAVALKLRTSASNGVVFDKIRVSSSAIGDNPT